METDPNGTARRWRVRPALPALKLTAAVLILLAGGLLGGDPVRLGLAALAAIGLLAWGLRDLLSPVRLAVDPAGVTVAVGVAGRRRLAWAQIERISAQTRPHLGIRTELLEIDTGESLYLFSANDLGAPPDEVAAALHAVREGAGAG
ncbi:PH domain-containing protein [Micromonospora sp. NPDC049679]|uniref:PH domain-containing protein n=1 Tax=Micromonospora sp. NPDC049679 TaxID=3155920 RepID=UPI0033D42C73